jgi:hypothetical protein
MPTIVKVTVKTVGTTLSVTVDPDPLVVPAGAHGPIQWKITNPASQGWKFQHNGVEILKAGKEFDTPKGGGARVFTWNNRHTKRGSYKYVVRLENGPTKTELDPTIMNN